MSHTNIDDLTLIRTPAPVREEIVRSMRQAIFEMKFAPGEKLVERKLCEMMGVSRTALREGLRQLESEGLIEVIPNRGPAIPKITRRQAKELYEIRIVLEGFVSVQAAAMATSANIRELRKIEKRIDRALTRRDRVALISAKLEFHELLLQITGNEELTGLMKNFLGRFSLLWPSMIAQSENAAESSQEIRAIVDAIACRNGAAAKEAVRVHLENASAMTLAYMRAEGWD